MLVECVRDYAIFMLDTDGYIVSWPAGAEHIKGLSAEEAVGADCSVFYTPEDVAAGIPQAHLDRARKFGRDLSEGWRVRKDGTQFWAEVLTVALRQPDDTLTGYAKVVRDATERHESLLALHQAARDSEVQSRAVLDTAVDAIITIDDRGRIETINPAGTRMFGYEAEDVIGRNVSMLMPQPFRGEHDGYLATYLKTGKASIIGIGREVVGLKKDGTRFPVDLAVSEMKLGHRRMFTGILHDISNRKRLEREILDISEREQRRIGQDLHDGLCQQLTGTSLLVRALQQKLALKAMPEVKDASQITELINDAITQARNLSHGLYPVAPQPQGLSTALQELAASISTQFRIRCACTCSEDLTPVDNSVATHLYRIAQESIQNAIRHGKASRVTISLDANSQRIRLCIKDNGVGIPLAVQPKTGLGLRTMTHRAHVIGASLQIVRAPRGGTRVTCELRRR